MELSPIVLFVYNRPWHTSKTLEALMANDLADQSILYIYADGPKPNASNEELERIEEVRSVIREKQWCKDVIIAEMQTNKGLANSIIDGVTEIVNKYGKIIVLEDDIVTTRGFLKYMNNALQVYEEEELVMHVSAYIYPYSCKCIEQTIFLKILSCWGWGTWSRAWKLYNHNVDDHVNYFNTIKKIRKFNIEGHANYYRQLIYNKENLGYTWAVRWYSSWLRAGGVSIFPNLSLIRNIGFDASGENIHQNSNKYVTPTTEYISVLRSNKITENVNVRKSIDKFYKTLNKDRLLKKILNKLTKYMIVKKLRNMLSFTLNIFSDSLNWISIKSTQTNTFVGKNVKLAPTYHIINSKIGDYTYISSNSSVFNTNIGKFCSVGVNFISGHGIHPINGLSTAPMFYSNRRQNGITLSGRNKIEEFKPVYIGNDVFIGDNVTILSGITIGDGAIIGAGAVVSKNIPPYAIAVGNPIEIKKYRFSQEQINALLRIRWWEFSDSRIKDVEKLFFNVDTFIDKYDKKV